MANIINILVYSVIIFLVLYTVFYWIFDLEKYKKWTHYQESIYWCGIIIILISFILDRMYRDDRSSLQYATLTNEQQENSFIEIDEMFLKYYPESLFLYYDIHGFGDQFTKGIKYDPAKRMQFEMVMSNFIFRKLENTYSLFAHGILPTKDEEYFEWLSIWKHWFKSPILRRNWIQNKSYYKTNTVNFIDNTILSSNVAEESF